MKQQRFYRLFRRMLIVGLILPAVLNNPNRFYDWECTILQQFFLGVCDAAEEVEIFNIDVGKQKESIEKDFIKLEEFLSDAKLQEARSVLDVLDHKIERMRKKVTKDELEIFRQKIDKKRKMIPVKEDSLVAKALDLLHAQGVDTSLQYTQKDLRVHGVPEKKIIAVEKKILKEAPAIQQAHEREEIARVIQIMGNGGLPDSSVSPYIIKSARLIMKVKADSNKRVEDVKKPREMKEQERGGTGYIPELTKESRETTVLFSDTLKTDNSEYVGKASEAYNQQEEEKERKENGPMPLREIVEQELKKSGTLTLNRREPASDQIDLQDIKNKRQAAPETIPDRRESKSTSIYLQNYKNNQHDAQEKVIELYTLIEDNRGKIALGKFKKNRSFIAQYVDAEVFTILEQSIMQSLLESSPGALKGSETPIAGNAYSTYSKANSFGQERLDRINGFMRDNKIEAAYAEFKRSEKQLKAFMPANEFKQFKNMIKNAYKTRYPKKKK